jgi:hypothetical protein
MDGAADISFLKRVLAGLILGTLFAGGMTGAGVLLAAPPVAEVQLASR